MVLFPTSATSNLVLNGSWSAELTHPLDDKGRYKYIVEEAVVKMPGYNGDQLYRIKSVSKSDSGVTAEMEPIFYDSMDDCWLTDIRPTNDTGQEALTAMLAPNSKYSGQSNITNVATAYYQNMNFMEALNGDIDQSFIKRWGGEIIFDNFSVIVNTRAGADHGVTLQYGKNIPENGMSISVDTRDVVTRIYPVAYNGRMMNGNGYVDSPLISNYPTVKTAKMEFEDVKLIDDAEEGDEEDGVIICATQTELNAALTQKCNEQYNGGIDKPTVTIEADMVILAKTDQYKQYQVIENVSLGDTIHCKNEHLGITTDARIIDLTYDAINKKVTSVVIGDYEYNYFDGVTSSAEKIDNVISPNGNVMAEKVQGILNGIYTQLRLQSTEAQKVDGIAFKIEDLDPESPMYGAMVFGTQGFQIATQRTADGTDWDWKTFGTAKGFVADYLIGGILASQNYREGVQGFRMNLNTGEADIPSLEIDTSHLQVQITELQGDVGGLQTSMTEVQGDITDINGDIGNLQTDVDGVQNDVDNLQATTTQKFAEIKADVNGLTTTVGQVQTSVTKAQSTADAAQTAAGNAQTTANSAQTAAGNAQSAANSAQTAAGNAQSAADAAQDDVDALTTTVNTQFTQINQTTDSISQTVGSIQQVTDAQSESISQLNTSINNVPDLIENALDESGLTELKAQVSSIEQEADQIRIELTEVSQYGDTVEQINRFFDFLQAGLRISMDDSPFYTLLNETELGFYENGHRVAYISNNSLYISSARIQNDLILENPASGDLVRWYVDSAGYVCLQSTSA
jgi:phage minor structural protein